MTTEEARQVAAIARTADSGCSVCVGSIMDLLSQRFPEHAAEFTREGDEDYGDD